MVLVDKKGRRLLPVWKTVKHAYRFMWENWRMLAVPVGLAFIIQILVFIIQGIVLSSTYKTSLPSKVAVPHFGLSQISITLCYLLVEAAIMVALAVGIHRTILLNEIRPGLAFLRWGRNFWRYVLNGFLYYLMALAPIVPGAFVVGIGAGVLKSGGLALIAGVALVFLGLGVMIILPTRLSLSLPAAAVGERKRFTQSWRATRGNWWRLFGVMFFTALPGFVLAMLAQAPGAINRISALRHGISRTSEMVQPGIGSIILMAAVSAITAPALVATLSFSYDILVRGSDSWNSDRRTPELDTLGLWPDLTLYAAPIEQIRVADSDSPMFLHYDHRETAEDPSGASDAPPYGWIVEARAVRPALTHRLERLASVQILAPAEIERLERGPGGVEAHLKAPSNGVTRIKARLAVAADGRASATRDAAGIKIVKRDYGQTAIVCTVAHDIEHRNIAVEHFRSSGPFAILPLRGKRSSVVWCETPEDAARILALDDTGFMAELARRFDAILGGIAIEGPRFSYPLMAQLAHTYIGERLALVGDSAHVMHPVAGQGMNMGIRDAAALAEALLDARRLGLDIGDALTLERYAAWRRIDNLAMLAMTDGLVRLFSNDIAPLRLGRDIGIAAVQRMPRAKRLFTRYAMGLMGDLPRLMQGRAL